MRWKGNDRAGEVRPVEGLAPELLEEFAQLLQHLPEQWVAAGVVDREVKGQVFLARGPVATMRRAPSRRAPKQSARGPAGVRRRAAAIEASISIPRRTSSVSSSASRQTARLDGERQVHRAARNRLEDVGAAADARLQHAERLELAHGLAQAGAADPERLHQTPARGEDGRRAPSRRPRCRSDSASATCRARPSGGSAASNGRRMCRFAGHALILPLRNIRRQTNYEIKRLVDVAAPAPVTQLKHPEGADGPGRKPWAGMRRWAAPQRGRRARSRRPHAA